MFIAQLEKTEIGVAQYILIVFTALLASMASTSMPSAGLITIVMVLGVIDVEDDKIALILPVV